MKKKESEIRYAMRMSTTEGILATSFMILSVGGNNAGPFLIGYALLLGASDFQISILAALPYALQVFQFFGAIAAQKIGGRRKFVAINAFLGKSIFVVLGVLLYIPFFSSQDKIFIFFFVFIFYLATVIMGGNAWQSWMGDLFPEKIIGTYFGFRNGVFSIVTIIVSYIGAFVLDYFIDSGKRETGFSVIMLFGGIIGGISALFFLKHPERKIAIREDLDYFDLILEPLRNVQFRKILTFFFLWNFSIGIAAAFFPVHMLRYLEMSFSEIALQQILVAAFAFISSRLWGSMIDRFGSKSVLLANAAVICLLPLLWLFATKNFTLPIFLEAVLNGISWTGFNLAAFTFPISTSPKENREFYLASFGIIAGLGFLISSLLGGILAQGISTLNISLFGFNFINFHILFLITFLLRIASTIHLRLLKEPEERGIGLMFTFVSTTFQRATIYGSQAIPLITIALPKKIIRSVGDISYGITQKIGDLSEGVSTVVTNISSDVSEKVTSISDNITTKVENISSGISNIIINLTDDLFEKVEHISDNILETISELSKKTISILKYTKKKDEDNE